MLRVLPAWEKGLNKKKPTQSVNKNAGNRERGQSETWPVWHGRDSWSHHSPLCPSLMPGPHPLPSHTLNTEYGGPIFFLHQLGFCYLWPKVPWLRTQRKGHKGRRCCPRVRFFRGRDGYPGCSTSSHQWSGQISFASQWARREKRWDELNWLHPTHSLRSPTVTQLLFFFIPGLGPSLIYNVLPLTATLTHWLTWEDTYVFS